MNKLCFCIEDPILVQQLEKPVLDGSLAVKLLVSNGFLSSHVPTVHTVLTFVHSLVSWFPQFYLKRGNKLETGSFRVFSKRKIPRMSNKFQIFTTCLQKFLKFFYTQCCETFLHVNHIIITIFSNINYSLKSSHIQ